MKVAELKRGAAYRYKGYGKSGYGIFRGAEGTGEKQRLIFLSLEGDVYTKPVGIELVPELDFGRQKTWDKIAREGFDLGKKNRAELCQDLTGLTLSPTCFHSYMGTSEVIRLCNRLEVWFAAQLEKHHIYWQSDPEEFVFQNSSRYMPDFYIPEIDLYVELTVSHRNQKRRKLAHLRREYGKRITCLHLGNLTQFRDLCLGGATGDEIIDWLDKNRERTKLKSRKVA